MLVPVHCFEFIKILKTSHNVDMFVISRQPLLLNSSLVGSAFESPHGKVNTDFDIVERMALITFCNQFEIKR